MSNIRLVDVIAFVLFFLVLSFSHGCIAQNHLFWMIDGTKHTFEWGIEHK